MHRSAVTAALLVALALVAPDVLAVDPTATFTLPNPGARSMALGGAFVAQADDATAAFANPAGLVQLLKPEFSAEARFWLYSSNTKEGLAGSDDAIVDLSGVGFLSAVYPAGPFSLTVYRNQLAKFEVDSGVDTWYGDLWNVNSFEIVTWGLAGAYRVTETLSVGLGAAYHEGEVESQVNGGVVRSESHEWSANVGVLWKPSDAFNLGGFYRQGADLDLEEDLPGAIGLSTSPLAVPDVFGLGVAWRSTGGSLALLTEWDHVRYSSVDGAVIGDAVVLFDDADEIHVGAEYAFLITQPIIAVRVGAWLDPSHRSLMSAGTRSPLDSDEVHFSSGMGLAWPHFQLDFALDLSDPVITFSLSGIVSF